jgi:hypothetical protein
MAGNKLILFIMTNELINKLAENLTGVIYFDSLTFIESRKYKIEGRDKSLYLIFAAYNSKLRLFNQVTYGVHDQLVEIRFHPVNIT